MYLLLNISQDNVREYDTIESIDEAEVRLSRKMERNHNVMTPEVEFMGHCSNIQAWAENEYDTRILHRNLAFPLLKRLTEVGDPIAKKKFKEEVAIRLASGHPTVTSFLINGGYLKYLNVEEIEAVLEDFNPPIINELIPAIVRTLDDPEITETEKVVNSYINQLLRMFRVNSSYVALLKLIKNIPERLKQQIIMIIFRKFKNNKRFPMFKFLNCSQVDVDNIEDGEFVKYKKKLIGILTGNKLDLRDRGIEKIDMLEGLKPLSTKIEELDLSNNEISDIKGLEILQNLKILNLSFNERITEIPETLNELPFLEKVIFKECRIKKFSDSTEKFFWMNYNYRAYANYTPEEVRYYENTHSGGAMSNNGVYKRFIVWLFKLRAILKEFNFSMKDIERYESKTENIALRSIRPTKAFKNWLFDRFQTKITYFIDLKQKKEKTQKNALDDKINEVDKNKTKP